MTPPQKKLSDLSSARLGLIRLCQQINYGELRDLGVREKEPVLTDSQATVSLDIKLHPREAAREELALVDFALPAEWIEFLAQLDDLQLGLISRIEIRAGVPRRITIEKPLSAMNPLAFPARPSD